MLRADAPAFVPHVPVDTITSSTRRRSTRPARTAKQPKKEGRAEEKNKGGHRHSRRRPRRKNGDANIKVECSNCGGQRQTKNHQSSIPRKRTSRRNKRTNDLPVEEDLEPTESFRRKESSVTTAFSNDEKAFPALPIQKVSENPSSNNPQMCIWDYEETKDWGLMKETAKETKDASLDSSSQDLSSRQGLTVLHPLRKTTGVELNSKDAYCETEPARHASKDKDEDTPVLVPSLLCRGRFDMKKLRDRWWDLVKNRPLLPPAMKESVTNEESTHITRPEYSTELVPCNTNDGGCLLSETWRDLPANPTLDASYNVAEDPIFEAVRRCDPNALRSLLTMKTTSPIHRETMSPLQLATHLDQPHLVQLLVSAARKGTSFHVDSPLFPPALVMAAERGYDECLQVLLCRGSLVTSTKGNNGDNVLHACCRGPGSTTSTMDLLLSLGVSSVGKLLSATNDKQQTPLHIACSYGRVDLVDMFLTSWSSSAGSFAYLSKVMAMQDVEQQTPLLSAVASGSTDVVMSLLMWRGNNATSRPGSVHSASMRKAPSALAWAVRSKNLDMVMLLLEFSDPSGCTGYDLSEVLRNAVLDRSKVEDDADNRVSLEILRALINAGSNPCETFSSRKYATQGKPERSAVAIAAGQCDAEAVTTLMAEYTSSLHRTRTARRRDPVLANQPESFFASFESKENAERKLALQDALETSLLLQQKKDPIQSRRAFECTMALFHEDAHLSMNSLARLECSLKQQPINHVALNHCNESNYLLYETSYDHPVDSSYGVQDDTIKALGYWSRVLAQQPWRAEECGCTWFDTAPSSNKHLDNNFVLTTEDGGRFEVHSEILSRKSAKLAAAFRFASVSCEGSQDLKLPEMQVGIPRTLCVKLLHHIYHGSLPCSRPSSSGDTMGRRRQVLMELLLIGDEFLCPSLIQECEMRLLSTEDHANRCHCWHCTEKRSLLKENNAVSCCYTTSGPISTDVPCYYLTADVCLDIISIAQHVGQQFSDAVRSYRIGVGFGSERVAGRISSLFHPLEVLRIVCVYTILQEFETVVRSSAFMAYVKDSDDSVQSVQQMLLEMCLTEIQRLPTLLHQFQPASLSSARPCS